MSDQAGTAAAPSAEEVLAELLRTTLSAVELAGKVIRKEVSTLPGQDQKTAMEIIGQAPALIDQLRPLLPRPQGRGGST